MFADRNASQFHPVGLSTEHASLSAWSSPTLNHRFEAGHKEHLHGDARRPLAPHEFAALVQQGHFEQAVRGLGFIINSWDVQQRLSLLPGVERPCFDDALKAVSLNNSPVPLSPAERSVVKMMHALRNIGLDSSTHAGDRAVGLIAPYADRLNANASPRYGTTEGLYSYRVLGAASLVAAETNRLAAAQPCGVQILRAAQERGLPRILITSHHSLGGDAVPLIAEHCFREGLLAGEVSCQRLGFSARCPDIFWIFKEDPAAWLEGFDALASQCHGHHGNLLVVEDTLGVLSDEIAAVPVEEVIRQAHSQCAGLRNSPLIIARDEEDALHAMENMPLVGIVTDLFIPTRLGSFDKSCGEATVREVLLPYLEHSEIDQLLRDGRTIEQEVAAIIEREFATLLSL
jgi:hypothetical protein